MFFVINRVDLQSYYFRRDRSRWRKRGLRVWYAVANKVFMLPRSFYGGRLGDSKRPRDPTQGVENGVLLQALAEVK